MKIKICGLRETKNIESLMQLQPDYVGFIFYDKSKRYAEGHLDAKFTKSSRFNESGILKTGVFVNEKLDTIKKYIEKYGLNAVQLHGDESVEFCKEVTNLRNALKASQKLEVAKVFSIDDSFDFSVVKNYELVCDYFLFDTKGKERGGNGIAFNWKILNKYSGDKPFFLSGGITPNDAAAVKKIKHPKLYGVDINSRFETGPGLKDVEVVRKFINELRK